jgi:hypothetical protein
MPRVEINSGGRHVVVESTDDLDEVVERARTLWLSAEQSAKPTGAFGFVGERRSTSTYYPIEMWEPTA